MTGKIEDIYDKEFVKGLFNRMAKTYGVANYLSSFGFTEIWRRQCIQSLPAVMPQAVGYDFMTGMGEVWTHLFEKLGSDARVVAVDISEVMIAKANEHKRRIPERTIHVVQCDVLANQFPADSADFIVSGFGLKTFNKEQTRQLAREVARILKPGGTFSFIEISEPRGWILKTFYMFYLKRVIPLIGRVFLNNSTDYRMLGKYCENFRDCRTFQNYLDQAGLKNHYKNYFFGCATGVIGQK